MSTTNLILTVMAKDKPGIVKLLSDAVYENGGNWLESNLARLGGQFAGIVLVEVPEAKLNNFKKALAEVVAEDISVRIQSLELSEEKTPPLVNIHLEANDRPGIVDEISSILADKNINVEKLSTTCQSASMAGYSLFQAEILVSLPKRFTEAKLQILLENLSDDVMVTIE